MGEGDKEKILEILSAEGLLKEEQIQVIRSKEAFQRAKILKSKGSAVRYALVSKSFISFVDVIDFLKINPPGGDNKFLPPMSSWKLLRSTSLPVAFGEKVVIRIFDPAVLMQDIGDLGFFLRELRLFKLFIAHPHGLILVTGPTREGMSGLQGYGIHWKGRDIRDYGDERKNSKCC